MENVQQQQNFTVAVLGSSGMNPVSLLPQQTVSTRLMAAATPSTFDPNISMVQQIGMLQQQQQTFPTTAFYQPQPMQNPSSCIIQNTPNNAVSLVSLNPTAPFPLPPGFQFLQTSQGLQIVRVIQPQNNIVQIVASVNAAPPSNLLPQESQAPLLSNQIPTIVAPTVESQSEILQPPPAPNVFLSSPVPPLASEIPAQPVQMLPQPQQQWGPSGVQQILLLSPLQNNPSNPSLFGVSLNPTTPPSSSLNLPLNVVYPSPRMPTNQTVNLVQPVTTTVPSLPPQIQKVEELEDTRPAFATVPPPQSPDSTQQEANQITIRETQSNVVEGVDLEEIRQFAKAFKIRRLTLGLTQTQVGRALSAREGPAYSQSAICRFEKLDLTPRSALKILPVLKRWITETEQKYKKGQRDLVEFVGPLSSSKARRKRTTFPCPILEKLNEYFEHCSHPAGEEITRLAKELGYGRDVVRIWFCNKRQSLKGGARSSKSTKIVDPSPKVV